MQGPQGTQGLQGDQGTQGLQGVQGLQGQQGSQGAQGSQGMQGVQGAQGNQGMQGTQGHQGSQGVPGGPGFTFTDSTVPLVVLQFGESVSILMDPLYNTVNSNLFPGSILAMQDSGLNRGGYLTVTFVSFSSGLFTITVENTYEYQGPVDVSGSRQCLLTGPSGPQGFQGAQGTQGPQGCQGCQGVQGCQGGQGDQGTQGPQGAPGGPAFTYTNTTVPLTTLSYGQSVGVEMNPLYNDVNSNLAVGSIVTMQSSGPNQGGYLTVIGILFSSGTYVVTFLNGYSLQFPVTVSASRQCILTGPSGTQGFQGPQGSQGCQGNQGFQGLQVT